jgi:hypothetical protein
MPTRGTAKAWHPPHRGSLTQVIGVVEPGFEFGVDVGGLGEFEFVVVAAGGGLLGLEEARAGEGLVGFDGQEEAVLADLDAGGGGAAGEVDGRLLRFLADVAEAAKGGDDLVVDRPQRRFAGE